MEALLYLPTIQAEGTSLIWNLAFLQQKGKSTRVCLDQLYIHLSAPKSLTTAIASHMVQLPLPPLHPDVY